jgi:hypothetical protein
LALAGLATFSVGTASAQIVSPFTQPNFRPGYRGPGLSPYLNLIRPGDPATNYFLLTIPEQQRRQNNLLFGSALNTLDERERRLELPPLDQDLLRTRIQSGHPTATGTTLNYFNDTRGYYPIPPSSAAVIAPLRRPVNPKR